MCTLDVAKSQESLCKVRHNSFISFKNIIQLLQFFMEKPSRNLQALAGEPVHFLGIKAKSFLPLISKAVGQR